jgi:glycosyltransferase involved in cell wall biosynthesis
MTARTSHMIALVIPAYNEASTIVDIVQKAMQFTDMVIVVNDGSSDNTAQVLDGLPVTLLNNPQNIGKGKSLLRGTNYAIEQGANSIITMDGDGQHQPEDIPLLLDEAALNPNTIIIAARLRKRHIAPPLRRFANAFADFWISWAAGQKIRDSQSGFRLYPAETFKRCSTKSDNFVFESEILIDAAYKGIFSKGVAIDTVYHQCARPSHYRPATDTWAIVMMVATKLINRGFYPLGLLRSLGIWPRSHVARQLKTN